MTETLPVSLPRQRQGSRLELIQVARGCAASAVVLYHCARHLNANTSMPLLVAVFQFGHAGVDLFFVISGFIITHVHLGDIGQPARFGHYLRRRFQRVYPLYWIATALSLLLGSIHHPFPPPGFLAASVSLYPFAPELIVGVAWTLQLEIVFYLVVGLIILNRRIGFTIAGLWLALVVAALAGVQFAATPHRLDSPLNLEFLFGAIGAILYHRRPNAIPGWLIWVGLALLALGAIAENAGLINYLNDADCCLAYGLPSALIVLWAAGRGSDRAASWPILRSLGNASYSIYLFQFIFIGLTWQAWLLVEPKLNLPIWLAFPTLAAAAIIGGIVVSQRCEYPLLRLMRRRTG